MSIGLTKEKIWSDDDLNNVVKNICPAFNEVVEQAHAKNTTLIFATGNNHEDPTHFIPAAC